MAYSEVEKLAGEAGDFEVTVRRKARYIDESKCTGCGSCAEKCPTFVADDFNERLAQRKAIYKHFAQGIPSVYTIDARYCRQLTGKKCGVCKKVCQAGAVDFEQQDRVIEFKVGAVVVAAGYDVFDPSVIPEYGYGKIANVVTAIEFERLLSASGPTGGHLDRPSDRKVEEEIQDLKKEILKSTKMLERMEQKFGESSSDFNRKVQEENLVLDGEHTEWMDKYLAHKSIEARLHGLEEKASTFSVAKRLAFIQCVGSRDFRFNPFCSGYCCMHSVKEAIIAREHEPETQPFIFGMDIRAVGKGFEEYKVRGGRNSSIDYIRGRVAEITEGPGANPVVWYEDTREQQVKSLVVDLVILATACVPTKGIEELAHILGIEMDEYKFIKTDPLHPLDTTRQGIFVCGCAQAPMDIPESVAQASSAAARAAELVKSREKKRAA
jgi:heterodisulfide reductase subunit A-like polyferredoxin